MLHRFKTFESYFEINIEDIRDDEEVDAYFGRIVNSSEKELKMLAISKIEDKVISFCHEKGFEIINIDKKSFDIEIKNHHNQYFKLFFGGIGVGLFSLTQCAITDDKEDKKDYKANELQDQYSVLKYIFDIISKTKPIVIDAEKGGKYYLNPSLTLFQYLDIDIDKNREVANHNLHEAANRLWKKFKEVYNIEISGKNDFIYRGRKFRYTGLAMFELTA